MYNVEWPHNEPIILALCITQTTYHPAEQKFCWGFPQLEGSYVNGGNVYALQIDASSNPFSLCGWLH